MIPALHPYPAYKPSGVPWLGDVPEHWEEPRLKDIGYLENQCARKVSPFTLR